MKRKVVALVAVISLAFVGISFAAVTGTRHDLSSVSGGITDASTNTAQICVFCHTPHEAIVGAQPLWNHTLSAASYTVYGQAESATMDSNPTDFTGASGIVSSLCMSCHDGTIGVNSLSNDPNDAGADPTMGSGTELTAGTFTILAGRPTRLGADLTNDHPINMDYTTAGAGLRAITAGPPPVVDDGTYQIPLFNGTTGITNSVQCGSCHDPHDDTYPSFLRAPISGSTLCLVCHLK